MGLGALPPPIFKLFFLFLRAWMQLSSALPVAFEACSPIVTLGSYLSGDPPGNSSWTVPSLTQTGESYCLNLLVLGTTVQHTVQHTSLWPRDRARRRRAALDTTVQHTVQHTSLW